MTGVRSRVGKLLSAVGTFERLLTAVYSQVLLQVMFKFKSFITIVAFEFPQQGALVVANHVPLQSVHVGEALVADLACLWTRKLHIRFSIWSETYLNYIARESSSDVGPL